MRYALLVAIAISGCSFDGIRPPAPDPQPRAPVVVRVPTPVCAGKQQCEAMWINAIEQLQSITGMRLQNVSESMIQTYGPVRGAQLGGMATRYPVGDDRYEIRVRFICRYESPDCNDLKASATNLFNVMVPGPIK